MTKLISKHYEGSKGTYKVLKFYNEYLLEFTSKDAKEHWMYSYPSIEQAERYMEKFDKYKK